MEERNLMAPCGIDCSACKIYRAKDEPEIMGEILDWFQKQRGLALSPEQVKCGGCLGDRTIHWSSDCEILKCSVDDNGFSSCSDCPEMPCRRLEDWAKNGSKYASALDKLKQMRSMKQG